MKSEFVALDCISPMSTRVARAVRVSEAPLKWRSLRGRHGENVASCTVLQCCGDFWCCLRRVLRAWECLFWRGGLGVLIVFFAFLCVFFLVDCNVFFLSFGGEALVSALYFLCFIALFVFASFSSIVLFMFGV